MDVKTKLILAKIYVVVFFGLPAFLDTSSGDEDVQAGNGEWLPWALFLLVLLDLGLNRIQVSRWFYSLLGIFMGYLAISIFALETPFELNAYMWLIAISPIMLVVWYCWRHRETRGGARDVNPHA